MWLPGSPHPNRKLIDRGLEPERLPPGQYLTEKWPVFHAGSVPVIDPAAYRFELTGLVERPLSLTLGELRALPATDLRCDIHCVTRWSRFDMPWRGVRFRDLAELATPRPDAAFAIAHAAGGYTTNLPLDALLADDVLVAYEADGAPLEAEHGAPVRLMVPSRYFWKSAKWLHAIELVPDDRPGYWEELGYHNDADPFREERYAF